MVCKWNKMELAKLQKMALAKWKLEKLDNGKMEMEKLEKWKWEKLPPVRQPLHAVVAREDRYYESPESARSETSRHVPRMASKTKSHPFPTVVAVGCASVAIAIELPSKQQDLLTFR